MMELAGQLLKSLNNVWQIFNLFNTPEQRKKKEQRNEQKYQDGVENALKKGKAHELDKNLS